MKEKNVYRTFIPKSITCILVGLAILFVLNCITNIMCIFTCNNVSDDK